MPDVLKSSQAARTIILLGDCWSSLRGGVVSVNRSLALSLASYKGVKTYCTLLQPLREVTQEDQNEADENHVTLLSLAQNGESMDQMHAKLRDDPLAVLSPLTQAVPHVSHIVGHSPITAEAALSLRDEVYLYAKVLLFYHVIPGEVEWLDGQLPYQIPTDSELVALGEQADVIYSVTSKLFWYFTAKFRNRAQQEVDHRLFLPQCTEAVFHIDRKDAPSGDQTAKILVLGGDVTSGYSWGGLDVAACAVNKVAAAQIEGSSVRPLDPVLKIGGLPKETLDDVKRSLGQYSEKAKIEFTTYENKDELYKDLASFDLCLVPSRAEPFGHVGLHALSAGIPTLLAEEAALSSTLKKLTSDPEEFLGELDMLDLRKYSVPR